MKKKADVMRKPVLEKCTKITVFYYVKIINLPGPSPDPSKGSWSVDPYIIKSKGLLISIRISAFQISKGYVRRCDFACARFPYIMYNHTK